MNKRRWDVQRMKQMGSKFITSYISDTPLGLPEMTEADFGKVMDAVTRSMASAYQAGYTAGLDQP